ncbi:uncharacterized protein LOC119829597 isoform X1 [Zerene cesonia]|uniref:uncharacterized protein LOC119829597 isoform X1 n=2 Tax=Zerene cesonia TaxID=33412 RepID=UPI0018E57291|nr:uncharacterized protein LOC119829597 isoform X1 [Zerene cesonia]
MYVMSEEHNKLPKSVLSYYVQLYCKKRNINKNISKRKSLVAEATRSWLNLSSSKRKILTMKYENCYLKLRKRFADKLRNTIPFSNKNQIPETKIDCISRTHSVDDVCNITSQMSENENNQSIHESNQSICSVDHQQRDDEKNESQWPNASILKPCPPQFRTTKELYYIINKNTEDLEPWESLTVTQRSKYSDAATRIKRLYLMEYTNYLENLSTEDLYTLYKNVNDT